MIEKTNLKEIWVVSCGGLTLYNQKIDKKLNDEGKAQLIGGFLTAISMYCHQANFGEFKSMVFGDSRLTAVSAKNGELIFIGLAPEKVNEKKVVEDLRNLSDFFLKTFKKELEGQVIDITLFQKIENRIAQSMMDWFGMNLTSEQSKRILDKL
jgi:hypothetical protein